MKSFDLTTTNAMSILGILLIFILFFEPRIYGTMIHTFLGRLTLLFILILITSYNQVYGLIAVILIISLFEYYDGSEGMENMNVSPHIPIRDLSIDSSSSVDVMDTSKKTELDIMSKPKSSKQLSFNSSTSSADASPSEASVTKTATKDGFANMFGSEYSQF
jgi:hypothetical protein